MSNLQPLYDVKERLEYAAIAGVSLLGEDFRLKRAGEGLKPLASASPVFGKIDAGLDKLLTAPAEQRPGLLLDVLALVDAVAYTQAKTGADGDLERLPTGSGSYRRMSYAQLHPLLDALTGTGGGRMNQIKDIWENHPEFFGDYRVLPVLVEHLGESYSELADLIFEIARAQGTEIVPLLKQGFDPAGKRDMARRAQLMDAVAGAGENGWYLEQLPAAKKQVREALLFALRHDPGNWEKLVELCQTEKKDCQAAAHWALARLDTAETLPYWRALAEKEPDTVLDYLRQSPTKTAAYLAADLFSCDLERYGPSFPLDEKVWTHISKLLFALDGKTGPEIWQVYRQGAALGAALDRDVTVERDGRKKKEPMGFWCFAGGVETSNARRPFSSSLPAILLHSIQLTRDPGLCALSNELYERYGGVWAAPALCAALFTQDSEGAYRRAEEILQAKRHLFSLKKPVDKQSALKDATWGLWWNRDGGAFEYVLSTADPATVGRVPGERYERPALPYPLDPRWYELLMGIGGLDAQLMNLARPVEGPVGDKLGKYLYLKAVHSGDSRAFQTYTQALIGLGWTDWKGYWSKWVQAVGEADYYTTQSVLGRLPVSGKEKAAQLREVTDLIWAKKVKVKHGQWPDAQIKRWIAEWTSESD